jgi:hypothetical protein
MLLDPAATESERANAEGLKVRPEKQLAEEAKPEEKWTDIMFRLGGGVKEIRSQPLERATGQIMPSDLVECFVKALRGSGLHESCAERQFHSRKETDMAEAIRVKYLGVVFLVVALVTQAGMLSAQESVKHLNPVIEKLAAGKPFIGFQTGDLSLQNARTLAPADIDYVYLEMEHGPMDFTGLHQFTVGMIDKAAILKKGNVQPNVAIFARFAPYGREQAQWFVKQALDIGLMGVIFNGIDNADQALLAVRNMRYPQRRTSKYPDPALTSSPSQG